LPGMWTCTRLIPTQCIWGKSFSRPTLTTRSSMWKYTMPRIVTIACLLVCLSAPAFGQFGSNTARRVISGTAAPPATCNASPVDMYARTGATLPGLYVCLTTNTWSGPLATSAGAGTVSANNGVVNAIATYAAAGARLRWPLLQTRRAFPELAVGRLALVLQP